MFKSKKIIKQLILATNKLTFGANQPKKDDRTAYLTETLNQESTQAAKTGFTALATVTAIKNVFPKNYPRSARWYIKIIPAKL